MIAFLDGIVAEVREQSLIIHTASFGFEVFSAKTTLMSASKGSAIRLYTHLAVKEDDLSLYGFHTEDLLSLFRYLISVSGVGPKLALSILSALPTTLVASAILSEDAGLLASAPGVGKKMAQRLILELKNKLPEHLMAQSGSARPKSILSEAGRDAVEALLTLGYRETQVKSAVAELALQAPDDSAESLIRKALSKLR